MTYDNPFRSYQLTQSRIDGPTLYRGDAAGDPTSGPVPVPVCHPKDTTGQNKIELNRPSQVKIDLNRPSQVEPNGA